MDQFDFIIVGGGSSGCVVASRLSEVPATRVLLIESGNHDTSPWIHIPATFSRVAEKNVDLINYEGEPSEHVNGRPTIIPQGHVIGGGSSVNAMIYIRGSAQDYDHWAQMGNLGWSYEDVLPVFRELENNRAFADEFHGTDGELHVGETGFQHPLSKAFILAAQQCGLPFNPDFNGASQEGVGFYQTTTHKGRRWSAAKAFLKTAKSRANLDLRTNTRVARVQFAEGKATGVMLEDGTTINAAQEVILCAGAIETPRLLQLSGVGEGAHLRDKGIDVVADLNGVGQNFQDHMGLDIQCYTKDPISLYGQDKGLRAAWHMLQYQLFKTGLLTSNVVESGGFADVSDGGVPDIQFHVLPALVGWFDNPAIERHGLTINPCNLRPRSRGSVRLRSSDAKDPALFDAGVFSDPEDFEILFRGAQKAIEIFRAPALAKLLDGFAKPGPEVVDDTEALRDWIRQSTKTIYHPAGTAKIGPKHDPMAVVDTKLRVKGVSHLRVVDASVMPTLVSGNTNAPTIMIAERAARFIREDQRGIG